MSEPRIIKKYPNRRLYDTESSMYITLEDVRQLVLGGTEFCVKDAKTGEDLTHSILLQIIAGQEDGPKPLLSNEMLVRLIRFYGDSMQEVVSDYLRKSLDMFIDQQQRFQEQVRRVSEASPFNPLSQAAETNLELWRRVQENFFRSMGTQSTGRNKPDDPPKSKTSFGSD